MSGFDAERKAIETRFKTQFEAAFPNVPVKYENVKFSQPVNESWVSLRILSLTSQQASIGASPTDRYTGEIQVDVLVSDDAGSKAANDIVDGISTIFKRQQFITDTGAYITCRVPKVFTMGLDEGFFRKVFTIEYYRDEN